MKYDASKTVSSSVRRAVRSPDTTQSVISEAVGASLAPAKLVIAFAEKMSSRLALIFALTASASAFVAPLPAAGRSRYIVASASEDYLTSTQKAVDVTQAAADVKAIIGDTPKEYAREGPAQFKRDPDAFKRVTKRTEAATTPAETEALPTVQIAVVLAAILAVVFLQ